MTTPDNLSHSFGQVGQSTYQWDHTCVGVKRLLTVGIPIVNPSGVTVTSVTYNGRPMNRVAADETGVIRAELWQFLDPALGTNPVEVTFSGSCDSWSFAQSFHDVGRTMENVSVHKGTNPDTDVAYNVTPTRNNSSAIDFIVIDSPGGVTPGGSQTQLIDFASGLLGISWAMSVQGPITPPAATAMTWDDLNPGDDYVILSFALAPAEGVYTRLGQFGVGLTPYGEFAAKPPAAAPQATYTRLAQFGIGVTPYLPFVAKPPASGGGGAATPPLYPIAVTVCNRGMMRG